MNSKIGFENGPVSVIKSTCLCQNIYRFLVSKEISSIIHSIYDLMGKYVSPITNEDTKEAHIDFVVEVVLGK
jgi:hypothetical protein